MKQPPTSVDHSEFRGYVFAHLFFKRISDLFQEAVRNLATVGDELANDPALQRKSLPFVVPPDCAWEAVTAGTAEKRVTSLQLGQSLNDAMLAIERKALWPAAISAAQTGRTHDRTRPMLQQRQKVLAKAPSTHDP
ncbi:MAG: type I restriction-modification system subunit M N-terminal domain-containing protein [Xanthobacteraceae bacterium]